jgi:hypothetical protein
MLSPQEVKLEQPQDDDQDWINSEYFAKTEEEVSIPDLKVEDEIKVKKAQTMNSSNDVYEQFGQIC